MSLRKNYLQGCLHLILTALICYLLIYPDTAPTDNMEEPSEIPLPLPITETEPKQEVATRITLWNTSKNQTEELPLEDYVLGVLAGEMPASYEPEALKAQAVGARTYTVQAMLSPESRHDCGAAVCTSSAHCQAYLDEAARRERWGDEFEYYETKLKNAVAETAGEVLTYQGQPIVVLYHSTSGGMTENVENVYSQALPYLRSVESPGEENSSHYSTEQSFSYENLANTLNAAFPDAGLKPSQLKNQLKILSRYQSGRVEKMQVGNAEVTGVQMRRALSLPSANFSLSYGLAKVTFTSIGYGHGVGMSQVGANIMAQNGSSYLDILTHYYSGVSLMQESEFDLSK